MKILDDYTKQLFDEEVLCLNVLQRRTRNVARLEASFIQWNHHNSYDHSKIDVHPTYGPKIGTGYMIFQLADHTLEEYMKTIPQPKSHQELLKLLENVSKLTDCLAAFHSPAMDARVEVKAIGVHHDLVRTYTRSSLRLNLSLTV